MIKNIFLNILVVIFCAGFVKAQNPSANRQLQKQEIFVNAGGLVFIDNKFPISSVTETTANDFVTYRNNHFNNGSFLELDKPSFDFTEKNTSEWKHGNIIIDKDGAFSKIGYLGVRQNIEVGYISSNENNITINVKVNDEPERHIVLKKGRVGIVPAGLLDPLDKGTKGYLAIQVYNFGSRPTPCSLDDIVNDVIDKGKPPTCK